ncbi:hypothetical protein Zmor_017739 [Zophobas morio]|uniref:Uncharacterized protein n=1 Tax=Zophobas morio TaxID=2755281 RepID=A0AA38ICZ8_9CUCU|nr:hypothetical protein Zmor_017739 [Zophobas morio]
MHNSDVSDYLTTHHLDLIMAKLNDITTSQLSLSGDIISLRDAHSKLLIDLDVKFKKLKSNLSNCIEAVDLQQKVIEEHSQTIKTMESKISQISDQSQNFGSNLENCKTTVENPSTKINNINSGNEGIASGPRPVLDLAELKDRVARMNNLIVYGIHESDDVSDECLCTKIFDATTSIVAGCRSYHVVHTQRISSKTLNKPQLL